jgi:L-rhamnose mutarotase
MLFKTNAEAGTFTALCTLHPRTFNEYPPASLTLLMIRKSFRMSVHAGHEDEYERRHNPIWPELEEALRRHGVHTYSIFLDPATRDLFGYVEVEDEARWEALAATPVCRRWWTSMRELMPSHADDSPVSRELREVFHIARPQAAR